MNISININLIKRTRVSMRNIGVPNGTSANCRSAERSSAELTVNTLLSYCTYSQLYNQYLSCMMSISYRKIEIYGHLSDVTHTHKSHGEFLSRILFLWGLNFQVDITYMCCPSTDVSENELKLSHRQNNNITYLTALECLLH